MTQGAPDASLLLRHLFALREAVTRLRAHAGATPETLLADPERRWAIERGLHLAAQNLLDIATHLAAAAGRDAPDYASAIDRLAEMGVVPPEFARKIRGIAGFRNVLVHGYLQVDLAIVSDVLTNRLSEFEEFTAYIEAWIEGGAAKARPDPSRG